MVVLAHASGAISVVELSWMAPRGSPPASKFPANGLVRHDSRRSSTYLTEIWPGAETARPAVQVPVNTSADDPYREEVADAAVMVRRRP